MKMTLKNALMLMMILSLVGLAACSDDDDDSNGGTTPPVPDPWIGSWLSAGTDVAPILVAFAGYDSVRVTYNDNQTILLETHTEATGWGSQNGIFTVTENDGTDITTVHIEYTNPSFTQDGIMQVWTATPDSMYLEVVQTVPDIGAAPVTPEGGFGSDPDLGVLNIQKYRKLD